MRIHLSRADVTEAECESVLRALRSGWVAPIGPEVDAFEAEVAARVGVGHAVALSSGTAALHLGLIGLGAAPGTAVVVPTMTFAASATPVVYAGAQPVFVDCLPDGNVDPDLLLRTVDQVRAEGTRVVAAVTVDLFGRCADYDRLAEGLARREIPLLEDAAEALGATYRGRAAGAFGSAGVLSFNGNKIMTTSGGGMLLSDDRDLIARARHLATQARQPVPYYQHEEIGYNYRLSNILAALGRAQLSRLDQMIRQRRDHRRAYAEALGAVPGIRFLGRDEPDRDDRDDNCWLTCVELDPGLIPVRPETLIERLADQGIEARRLWKPLHTQPVFRGCRQVLSGTAERLFDRGVALPSGSELEPSDIQRVIDTVLATITRQK